MTTSSHVAVFQALSGGFVISVRRFYSFQLFANPLSDENNCLVNLCQNGGECIDGLNNFDCECQELFCNL